MKSKIAKLNFPLFLLGALILSGCAGGNIAPNSYPGIMVHETTVYLANNAHIYAVDLQTGSEQWRYPNDPKSKVGFYASPTVTEDRQLIVGAYNHSLYSLDLETGKENWKFTDAKDRFIAPALAADGWIFAPNADGTLYALDLQGNLKWSFKTGGALWAKPVVDSECNCIFIPSMDHKIYAIDAQSGSERWVSEDLSGAIIGQPAFGSDKILYVGTFNREMLAINAEDGSVLWRAPTNGWVWGGPALTEKGLFFGDLGGYLHGLDATTGAPLWPAAQVDGPIAETPTVDGNTLYFTTRNGSIYTADFDGKTSSKNIGGTIYTAPVRAGEFLLVATTSTTKFLIANDIRFNEQWFYPPAEEK